MKFKNIDRLKAIDLFLDELNTATLSKDELILGIKTIVGKKHIITKKTQILYMHALDKIYREKK